MLRVASEAPPAPPEEEMMPQEQAVSTPAEVEPNEGGEGVVDPQIAGYMGPESGPFACEYCQHWRNPNSCEVVSGEIDAQGCCNLYTPAGKGEGMEERAELVDNPEEEATEHATTGV